MSYWLDEFHRLQFARQRMSPSSQVRSFVAVASTMCLAICSSGLRASAAFTEQGTTILGSINYDSRSASLADIDNDGDLDLFFQGAAAAQQLWRNNKINPTGPSSMTFTNITSSLPAGFSTSSWSAAWGDYDGDGMVDVFVGETNGGSETGDVLRNTPTGFLNKSVDVNLDDPSFHQNVAWNDIDNDNDLDLIIGMECSMT
jgi:enediyne biosynthesis protein E4